MNASALTRGTQWPSPHGTIPSSPQATSPLTALVMLLQLVESRHTALLSHGFDWHSSISTSQCAPTNPAAQLHVYKSTASVHTAPFRHGSDVQSSIFSEHVGPAQPAWQEHKNEPTATVASTVESRQTPTLHGSLKHSSMSASQSTPPQPCAHMHWYEFGPMSAHGGLSIRQLSMGTQGPEVVPHCSRPTRLHAKHGRFFSAVVES